MSCGKGVQSRLGLRFVFPVVAQFGLYLIPVVGGLGLITG